MARPADEIDSSTRPLALRMAEALGHADERLDAAIIAKAKLCLLDYFACAFAARELPWARQAVAAVTGAIEGAGSPPGHAAGPTATRGAPPASPAAEAAGARASANRDARATIIGTPLTAACADAAFANSVLGHGLVRDDMHLGSVSHLGVAVIPPVLALAETIAGTRGVSGRALIAALVAGYEAGGKLGRAILDVVVARIHRPTGITGPFAGAAALATLLGLDARATANALGLAANTAAGYNEWAATGGTEMFFHPGLAARSALMAVSLAAAGATASATALDGDAGILAAFGKRSRSVGLPFERRAEILDVFFKEVPACNFAQAPAQAARRIAADARDTAPTGRRDPADTPSRGRDPADTPSRGRVDAHAYGDARIVAHVSKAAQAYPGCDWPGPFPTVLKAKMSIQYNVAVALVTGAFDESSYEPARQPEIVALARRVEVVIDEALTRAFPARQAARVTVVDTGGRTREGAVDDVAPASDAFVRERFDAAARQALGAAAAAELARCIDGLDDWPDAGPLARLARTTRIAPAAPAQ